MSPFGIQDIVDAGVFGSSGRLLGHIDEIIVDLEAGRIVEVLLKLEDRRFKIPWDQLDFDSSKRCFRYMPSRGKAVSPAMPEWQAAAGGAGYGNNGSGGGAPEERA